MRTTLLLATALAVLPLTAGCEKTDKVSGVGMDARQAISEAALARYPGNPRTSREYQLAAVDYPKKNELEIHNLGGTSVPSSIVWVNGSFMTRIDGIAPKSVRTVKHGELLEAGPAPHDLKSLNQPVAKVELQTEQGLFTVQGPTINRD